MLLQNITPYKWVVYECGEAMGFGVSFLIVFDLAVVFDFLLLLETDFNLTHSDFVLATDFVFGSIFLFFSTDEL